MAAIQIAPSRKGGDSGSSNPPLVRYWQSGLGNRATLYQPYQSTYLPTRWPKSFSFSLQTYSISSVSGFRVNRRFTLHGLV